MLRRTHIADFLRRTDAHMPGRDHAHLATVVAACAVLVLVVAACVAPTATVSLTEPPESSVEPTGAPTPKRTQRPTDDGADGTDVGGATDDDENTDDAEDTEEPTIEPTSTLSPQAQVQSLNDHLEATGASWRAAENELLHLPPDELLKWTGAVVPDDYVSKPPGHPSLVGVDVASGRSYRPQSNSTQARANLQPLPDYVDWRGIGSRVRSQGGCGSCWAFASIAAVETERMRLGLSPESDLDLSEQRLVSCLRGDCRGNAVHEALEFLRTTGTVPESCTPYEADGRPDLCDRVCAAHEVVHISDWSDVVQPSTVCSDNPNRRNTDWNLAVARALAQDGALVAVMSVPYEFFAYDSGVYRHSGLDDSDRRAGCHAVALVGYSLNDRYWILKNSWGTGWGEDGYARVSWDDDRTHLGGLLYRIDAARPTVTPAPYPPPTGYPPPTRQPTQTPVPTVTPTPTKPPTLAPPPTSYPYP